MYKNILIILLCFLCITPLTKAADFQYESGYQSMQNDSLHYKNIYAGKVGWSATISLLQKEDEEKEISGNQAATSATGSRGSSGASSVSSQIIEDTNNPEIALDKEEMPESETEKNEDSSVLKEEVVINEVQKEIPEEQNNEEEAPLLITVERFKQKIEEQRAFFKKEEISQKEDEASEKDDVFIDLEVRNDTISIEQKNYPIITTVDDDEDLQEVFHAAANNYPDYQISKGPYWGMIIAILLLLFLSYKYFHHAYTKAQFNHRKISR